MRKLWLGSVLAASAAALMAGAGAASACIPSALGGGSPSGGSVEPGGTVRYTLAVKNTGDEAASTYTISITGVGAVASGTVGAGGIEGTFTMPDLGPGERTVTMMASTSDPSAENAPMSSSLSYRSVLARTQQEQTSETQPPATSSTAPATTAPATASKPAITVSHGPGTTPVKAGPPRPVARQSGTKPARPTSSMSKVPRSARMAAPQAARGPVAAAPVRARAAQAPPLAIRGVAAGPAQARATADARDTPSPIAKRTDGAPAFTPQLRPVAPHASEPPEDPSRLPGRVIVAALAVLLAGGLLISRRRRPTDPQPANEAATVLPAPNGAGAELSLEAELQELISAERAAHVARERPREPSGV